MASPSPRQTRARVGFRRRSLQIQRAHESTLAALKGMNHHSPTPFPTLAAPALKLPNPRSKCRNREPPPSYRRKCPYYARAEVRIPPLPSASSLPPCASVEPAAATPPHPRHPATRVAISGRTPSRRWAPACPPRRALRPGAARLGRQPRSAISPSIGELVASIHGASPRVAPLWRPNLTGGPAAVRSAAHSQD